MKRAAVVSIAILGAITIAGWAYPFSRAARPDYSRPASSFAGWGR